VAVWGSFRGIVVPPRRLYTAQDEPNTYAGLFSRTLTEISPCTAKLEHDLEMPKPLQLVRMGFSDTTENHRIDEE
jgi:hypothetical protein